MRFKRPVCPHEYMESQRLVRKLKLGANRALTLVSAPAGAGKTTLLAYFSQQIASPRRKIVWTSLDASDNVPKRFWRGVFSAFAKASPGTGVAAPADVANQSAGVAAPADAASQSAGLAALADAAGSDAGELPQLVMQLVDLLEESDDNYYLVIDDFHLVWETDIYQQLLMLVKDRPANLSIALGARFVRMEQFSRLSAYDQLVVVDGTQLCFTPEETEYFLNECMGLGLGSSDAQFVHAHTRGWAAAEQLAATVIRDFGHVQGEAAIGAIDRAITSFIACEVLASMHPERQLVLARLAALSKVNAELGELLVGKEACEAAIRDCLGSGFMLMEAANGWYQFFPPFRKAIEKTQGQFLEKDELAKIRSMASSWCEQHGRPSEAVEYAILNNDHVRCLRLVSMYYRRILSHTEGKELLLWLSQIPPQIREDNISYEIANAWANFIAGKPLESEKWLKMIRRRIQRRVDDFSLEPHQAELDVADLELVADTIEACSSSLKGDYRHGILMSRRVLERFEDMPDSANAELWLKAKALHNLGESLIRVGSFKEAYDTLCCAKACSRQSGRAISEMLSVYEIGELQFMAGNLDDAAATYYDALSLFETGKTEAVWTIGLLSVGLGRVWLWRNDIKMAESCYQRAIKRLKPESNIDGYIEAQILKAKIGYFTSDLAAAAAVMRELRGLLMGATVPRGMYSETLLCEANIAAAAGNAAHARSLLGEAEAHIPAEDVYYITELELVKGNLALSEALYKDADAHLSRAAALGERHTIKSLSLRALVSRTACLLRQGSTDDALAVLLEVLKLAAPQRVVSVFLEGGDAIGALLNTLIHNNHSRSIAFRRTYQELMPFACGVLEVFKEQRYRLADAADEADGQLTPQEQRVLEKLRDGKTRKEIAAELQISVNTVKVHVRSIYKKTGVHDKAFV